jgi:hypothetical protein
LIYSILLNIDEMTEVPLPLKFLFLLIGPAMEEYLEIGRALSTLFSTPVSDNVNEFSGIYFVYVGFPRNSLSSYGSS